ncbi:MAG TPA: 50S ribosomal protein L4 [Thermoplasmata archaeon]|nr:50S ribosomal protein L4 [Thermoplasmata archaeon]
MSRTRSPGPPPAQEGHTVAHHRVHLRKVDGGEGTQITLPTAFSSPIRTDLIRRAVVAAQANRRQPHGTAPMAGLRHSVEWSGKGKGVSRTPRLMDSNRGAQAPNTVGGRPAHPPRVETIWAKKVNTKERRLAFRSALAATREAALARARGHTFPETLHLPVVLDDPAEKIDSAADARELLASLKLWEDVERARDGVHVRAGRGKRRGRMRREPKSLLVVTSSPGRARGFGNFSGVDVVSIGRLGTEDLAPGGTPGRLTLFTHAAIEGLRTRLKEAAA